MTARVIHIDVWRPVWRTCTLSCRRCSHVWQGIVRDGISARDITCVYCKQRGAHVLSAGHPECLPLEMRKDLVMA